jgi:hypothetical protein
MSSFVVYEPNTDIIVNGLVSQPHLNGMKGKIHKYSKKQKRYLVVMENGTKLAVALSSLTLTNPNSTNTKNLRYVVGDDVQCNCSEGWIAGKVVHLNYTEPARTTEDGTVVPSDGNIHPYHVKGENNMRTWNINVPVDDDRHIRTFTGILALRFGVGARVVCWCGAEDGWMLGTVTKERVEDPNVFGGKKVPYQIKLDDGMIIYAPDDKPGVIRPFIPYDPRNPLRFVVGAAVECKYLKQWVVGTVSVVRYQNEKGEGRPYSIVLNDTGATIYAPVDDDMVIKLYNGVSSNPVRAKLRFGINTRVVCKCGEEWIPGTIIALYYKNPTTGGLLPYYVQSDDGILISVPKDDETIVRELVEGEEGYAFVEGKGLRFANGTEIECNCGEQGWCQGTIDAVYFRAIDEKTNIMKIFPYRIQLKKGGSVRCPVDNDDCIRNAVEIEDDDQVE